MSAAAGASPARRRQPGSRGRVTRRVHAGAHQSAIALGRRTSSACAVGQGRRRASSPQEADFILHPYPVTPFHGDYLHHADLAAAAKARFSDGSRLHSGPRPEGQGQRRPRADIRIGPRAMRDWDVEVVAVDAAELMASATLRRERLARPALAANRLVPCRALLGRCASTRCRRAGSASQSDLRAADAPAISRAWRNASIWSAISCTSLHGGCRKMVAGYTVKREYVNVEYSAGIENIGFDAIEGLRSPIFIRTVKLKDFPWNGWLALGIGGQPAAAWNPIGGMTDPFGRLMGAAVGDPALLPRPMTPAGCSIASPICRAAGAVRCVRRTGMSRCGLVSCARRCCSLSGSPQRSCRGHFRAAHRERPGTREHAAHSRQAERRREAAMEHGPAHEPSISTATISRSEIAPGTVSEMTFTARATGRFTIEPHLAIPRRSAWGRPCHHRGLSVGARSRPHSRPGLPATPAAAHGFGQRYDLPIPLSYYLVGTAAAVVVSFLIVGLFVRERAAPHAPVAIDLLATRLGRLLIAVRRSSLRSSSSHLPPSSSSSSRGCGATKIHTGTSRRPWCGSSGGSASPTSRPCSEISGR